MPPLQLPSFAELRRRYADDGEDPGFAVATWNSDIPPDEDHGCIIINYLRGLGHSPRTLDQLRAVIDDLQDDEIAAYRTREGLAVSQASDGWWVLFTDGDHRDS